MVEAQTSVGRPQRTCVICRRRFDKTELTRHVVVVDAGRCGPGLVIDPENRLTGRGFYVCNDAICREKFPRYTGWRKKWKGELERE
ncbi:YlxR family protein [Desulfovibrio inopinatus]|uniref:YlxR family protein n=1 Tax=Desulfovibrio inopinatus TaxID=102109 RepID=UPI000414A99F|nr:DUF448 domain-containing protein [Desulfovibrio inopinatus]